MEWKEVSYSKANVSIPSERWGHRMICTNSDELVLFGGFGGSALEGKYLNDVWSFSITNCTWQQFITSGSVPQSRSNYTLHYDDINNAIILFGGSSEHRVRSNSISILNWERKEWTEHHLQENNEAPWQRTYHSSEYHYPYLIIYGGEGPFGEDLDDMWVFDTIKIKWSRVNFKDSQSTPKKRRFHSTAFLNNYFYVIGGCNESYMLLGDMFRVDLSALFEKGQFSGFVWECVHSKHQILNRWGHSSLVYGQKIFIFGGKISAYLDFDNGATFDSITQNLAPISLHKTNPFPSRRRQSSAVIGNSLLIFGGFNGKYMNDFYYLALNNDTSMDFHCLVVGNSRQMAEELSKQEQKYTGDVTIKLFRKDKIEFLLKSDIAKLKKFNFFANLMEYSSKDNICLQLPSFCDVATFRLAHLCLIQKQIIFCPKMPMEYWINIAQTFQYLVCQSELQAFSRQLCRVVNEDNCMDLLKASIQLGMESLKRTAAQVYFLHQQSPPRKHRSSQLTTNESNFHIHPQTFEELEKSAKENEFQIQYGNLEEIYEVIKFDVEQKKLKEKRTLFSRLKSVFKSQNPETSGAEHKNHQGSEQNRRQENSSGCFRRLVAFFAGICENREEAQQ